MLLTTFFPTFYALKSKKRNYETGNQIRNSTFPKAQYQLRVIQNIFKEVRKNVQSKES